MSLSPTSPTPIGPKAFAIPARLHVFVTFMSQFMAAIAGIGILPFTLQQMGINSPLSWVLGVVAIILAYLIFAWLGRMVPVRCKSCSAAARYRGLGKWPFIYRYDCNACGVTRTLEIRGGV